MYKKTCSAGDATCFWSDKRSWRAETHCRMTWSLTCRSLWRFWRKAKPLWNTHKHFCLVFFFLDYQWLQNNTFTDDTWNTWQRKWPVIITWITPHQIKWFTRSGECRGSLKCLRTNFIKTKLRTWSLVSSAWIVKVMFSSAASHRFTSSLSAFPHWRETEMI